MDNLARPIDPVELTQALIRCPSITPHDAGALDLLARAASLLGFDCHPLLFEEEGTDPVHNLYARIGTDGPNFCFAGHTDVVPVGDEAAWSGDPFEGHIENGMLWGRGAADMKGAVGAFVAAADRYLGEMGPDFKGSISLLITGDEEGPAINGTIKMLDWAREHHEDIDHCLVGEPTNPTKLGEMMKIGRRGSICGTLRVFGAQGHVAYPHLADNPLPRLAEIVSRLSAHVIDEGTDHFPPTNLEFTSIDVGNGATNVIPGSGTAQFNIRFNDSQTPEGLESWLRETLDQAIVELGGAYELNLKTTGNAFLTSPGPYCDLVSDAVEAVTGMTPDMSTTGGTSDARFITNTCPVCEFGLSGQTMHKVDEHVPVQDIRDLSEIYYQILVRYFEWAA